MTVETFESEETPEPVYTDPVEEATARLKSEYPELTDDPRPGYTGIMVPPERLVEVATFLRDELGFNYLSSITGMDVIDENKMETVYHTYSIEKGGGAVVLKVQTDRENPVIPSLTPSGPAPISRSAKPTTCTASNSRAIPICAGFSCGMNLRASRCARTGASRSTRKSTSHSAAAGPKGPCSGPNSATHTARMCSIPRAGTPA